MPVTNGDVDALMAPIDTESPQTINELQMNMNCEDTPKRNAS